MADIKSAEKRSANMSAIRSKDTSPEMWFRKKLFSMGYRYRKNTPQVIGHPDVFLPHYNTAVFVHGCFWHRHAGCKFAYTPKSRIDFWEDKFSKNIGRDAFVKSELFTQRVKCLIIWECTIKQMRRNPVYCGSVFDTITQFFLSSDLYLEI